jgi:hypothetical protein
MAADRRRQGPYRPVLGTKVNFKLYRKSKAVTDYKELLAAGSRPKNATTGRFASKRATAGRFVLKKGVTGKYYFDLVSGLSFLPPNRRGGGEPPRGPPGPGVRAGSHRN